MRITRIEQLAVGQRFRAYRNDNDMFEGTWAGLDEDDDIYVMTHVSGINAGYTYLENTLYLPIQNVKMFLKYEVTVIAEPVSANIVLY